jgi:uncharacterized damage-inducible protein DinB
MSDSSSLARAYAGWEVYQQHLISAVAPLTPAQLALQAAPHLRSVGVIAAHIISARVWWFHYVLREGPADLEPMLDWDDDGAPARSAGELVAGLEATWAMMQDALARWTAADLDEIFRRPRGDTSRTYTRQSIIWHVIEHDLHHGGELSFALGMHGLPAIDL